MFIEEYNRNIKCDVNKYLLSISYIPGTTRAVTWSPLHRISQSSEKVGELPIKEYNTIWQSPCVPASAHALQKEAASLSSQISLRLEHVTFGAINRSSYWVLWSLGGYMSISQDLGQYLRG